MTCAQGQPHASFSTSSPRRSLVALTAILTHSLALLEGTTLFLMHFCIAGAQLRTWCAGLPHAFLNKIISEWRMQMLSFFFFYAIRNKGWRKNVWDDPDVLRKKDGWD